MHKSLAALVILGLISSTASAQTSRADYGADDSRAAHVGMASGMLLGAIAGGPPGVVIGGAIGALFGDHNSAKSKVADLTVDLLDSKTALAQRDQELESLKRRVLLAEQQLNSEKQRSARLINASLTQPGKDACCDNTIISLHFRSGSSAVESHYQEQLISLARLAKQMPSARIEVSGFADRTGAADRNLDLSRARAKAVAKLLEENGVAAATITTRGVGDTEPLAALQQFETDFFDRRVLVRLRDASQQFLTQSPDGQ